MTTPTFAPPLSTDSAFLADLQRQGFAVLGAAQVARLAAVPQPALQQWSASWNDLAVDAYLRDGGRYRRRRHSCFVVRPDGLIGPAGPDGPHSVTHVPHRAHWQPVEYNALHGGMQRQFEPMPQALVRQASWDQLLAWLGMVASAIKGAQPWFVEAHQFRIDTTDGIGRPTPEGAHRDGVDLVAVFLVQREAIKGGETRVFAADNQHGQRFTLDEPWSLLLLDDARVIHESTPIMPTAEGGLRDTLVVTLRAHGFQESIGQAALDSVHG